jgi:hypothetical protein
MLGAIFRPITILECRGADNILPRINSDVWYSNFLLEIKISFRCMYRWPIHLKHKTVSLKAFRSSYNIISAATS